MLALVGGLLVFLLALGRFYPGSGAQQLDWRPTRSVELEVQNDIDDLDQMREAINARRRARGEGELTEDAVRARVAEDLAERRRRGARGSPGPWGGAGGGGGGGAAGGGVQGRRRLPRPRPRPRAHRRGPRR